MIKERIPISGDLKSKVKQLMEYAGWQEGRKVDISIAEKYYADHGVPMMKTTQRFYRKYFGLCCEWYFCLLYTSPSPRDGATSRMPSSA